jgi:hypothetical protein
MRSIRSMLDQVREQIEAAGTTPMRPTSLQASTMWPDRLERRSNPPPEPVDDVEARRPRPAPRPVARPPAAPSTSLRATLRNPASLKTAMVLREVLGPPVGLRDPRDG